MEDSQEGSWNVLEASEEDSDDEDMSVSQLKKGSGESHPRGAYVEIEYEHEDPASQIL